MTQPEPWRRTGRKAKEDHWLGLEAGAVVEVSLYDDGGQQQGRGVIQLTARAIEDKDTEEGQTWRGQFLAIEDGYYEWWVENTYKMKILPFHFCARQSQQCAVKTLYREPIHIDVFRVIPEDGFLKLSWMTAEKKTEALKVFEAKTEGPGTGAARPGLSGAGTPGAGAPPEEVKEGEEGITGLARALGERVKESSRERGAEEEKPKKKCPRKEGDDKEEGLRAVISQRNAPLATGSALKMKGPSDKSKKRKRRDKRSGDRKERRKRRRDKEKNVDDETSEVSTPTTDSSEESLFQLAALPQGVDRLHRLHQERPGALANLTLQRFKELLERATGRGAAAEEVELPAVARAYLSQIWPETRRGA